MNPPQNSKVTSKENILIGNKQKKGKHRPQDSENVLKLVKKRKLCQSYKGKSTVFVTQFFILHLVKIQPFLTLQTWKIYMPINLNHKFIVVHGYAF